MEFTGFMPPDEFWAMQGQLEKEVREAADRLPLYQLDGWNGPLMLGSWLMDAREGSVLHGFLPHEPQVELFTTTRTPDELALERWRGIAGLPSSREELQLQDVVFQALEMRFISGAVDGERADFTVRSGPSYWLASGRAGNFGLVVVARGNHPEAQPLHLSRVPDVEPLLQARRDALKALRGEA